MGKRCFCEFLGLGSDALAPTMLQLELRSPVLATFTIACTVAWKCIGSPAPRSLLLETKQSRQNKTRFEGAGI